MLNTSNKSHTAHHTTRAGGIGDGQTPAACAHHGAFELQLPVPIAGGYFRYITPEGDGPGCAPQWRPRKHQTEATTPICRLAFATRRVWNPGEGAYRIFFRALKMTCSLRCRSALLCARRCASLRCAVFVGTRFTTSFPPNERTCLPPSSSMGHAASVSAVGTTPRVRCTWVQHRRLVPHVRNRTTHKAKLSARGRI